MSEFSNGLTLAEEEMLTLTIEECSEVIKACTKILRHGLYSRNCEGRAMWNITALKEESADVLACFGVLAKNGWIDPHELYDAAREKLARLKDPEERRVHHITADMIP